MLRLLFSLFRLFLKHDNVYYVNLLRGFLDSNFRPRAVRVGSSSQIRNTTRPTPGDHSPGRGALAFVNSIRLLKRQIKGA